MSDAADFALKHTGATVSLKQYDPMGPEFIVEAKVVGWLDSAFWNARVLMEPRMPDLGEPEFAEIRDRNTMDAMAGYHWLIDVDRFIGSPVWTLTLVRTVRAGITWPHTCQACQQPAQIVFNFIDCSNSMCRHYRP